MNLIEIYANDKPLDLYSDTNIKFTKQANDIGEIDKRQASYTNSFTIPKTPNNIQVFGGLGLTSDTSRIPYQKPNCKMKIDGFDLIVKGWMNIMETTDDEYKVYVYSGVINFFKAIENLTIGNDLDIDDIGHTKDVETVIASFDNENYKYLIADFNGNTHIGTNRDVINIDYIVPSVRVKYLWDKIHKGTPKLYSTGKYPAEGFTYIGEIFNSERFKNLWLTYPRPTDEKTIKYTTVLDTEGQGGLRNWNSNSPTNNNTYAHILPLESKNTFKIDKDGVYRITFSFNLNPENPQSNPRPEAPFELYIGKNVPPDKLYDNIGNSTPIKRMEQVDNINNEPLTIPSLKANDELTFFYYFKLNGLTLNYDYKVKIERVEEVIDFSEQLKEFSVTDFVKEIINHFGLTMFTDEFSDEISYKTLNERINNSRVIDWSEKYIGRKSEEYIANSYAQRNYFEYQHNDKEETHNNGFIRVRNENIEARKTVFGSKTYSPEELGTKFYINNRVTENTPVFRLYNKEVNEDPKEPIKYKPLQNRYYLVRARLLSEKVKIGSKQLNQEMDSDKIYLGNFSDLDFDTVIRDNYSDFTKILNDSRLHTVELNLNTMDILLFNHDALYYFSQEQQYYILNKLQYDNKSAKGEFIRIGVSEYSEVGIEWRESYVSWSDEDWQVIVEGDMNGKGTYYGEKSSSIIYVNAIGNPEEMVLQRRINNKSWTDIKDVKGDERTSVDFQRGQNDFRVKYLKNGIVNYSNTLTYFNTSIDKSDLNCYSFDIYYDSSWDNTSVLYYDKNWEEKGYVFIPPKSNATIYGKAIIDLRKAVITAQREIDCTTIQN
ncbi:hypothetical protein CMT52_17480 [Elizabethkingia anophelis]|nr:hypothetical protein [Elizabethkingia anophelis]